MGRNKGKIGAKKIEQRLWLRASGWDGALMWKNVMDKDEESMNEKGMLICD